MGKVFLIDVKQCNGCYNCQIVCKDEHCENDWRPYAAPQPLTGQFWLKMDEKVRGQVPWTRVAYKPVMCQHCEKCPVLELGAADGAAYRRDDGLVIIDPEKAAGRRDLVEACPLGAVYWNEELALPQKCTGCAHLLDNGWDVPRCVDACATGALRVVDEDELAGLAEGVSCADELAGRGSHVLYANKPGRFVAGCVADRSVNEVVIGAAVTAFDEAGALVSSTSTDEFGDFMFDFADGGRYLVRIEAHGYAPVELDADCAELDVVFDDVFVTAAIE